MAPMHWHERLGLFLGAVGVIAVGVLLYVHAAMQNRLPMSHPMLPIVLGITVVNLLLRAFRPDSVPLSARRFVIAGAALGVAVIWLWIRQL